MRRQARANYPLQGSGCLLVSFIVTRLIGGAEGVGDALVGGMGLPVDAVGVDLQQDRDAVPGAAGASADLAGRSGPPGLLGITVSLTLRFPADHGTVRPRRLEP
ncbi:MAG: hypothetical protein ACRDNZ_09020, partial [Streptosporangiaceae bacterium]